ncbi:MAG: dihydrodipicolinate synthase family protein [Candidatus Latescibacterota bacterium]
MTPRQRDDLRSAFNARGVCVFVMTPFESARDRTGRFAPDLAGMAANTRHFSQVPGEKMLVICGGSGEFHSLRPAEVIGLAEAAVAGVEGRCRLIVGVGGPTRNAVRMAEKVQEAGGDAVLVMPHPPEVRRGEQAVYERHRQIARAVDIGVWPFRAGSQLLSAEILARLIALPNVVAIKEESNAVDWVRTGVRLCQGRVPIITGGGENMVPYYYLAGAVGFTTGMANITLPRSIDLHNAAIARDWDRAMEWRDYFEPLTLTRGRLGTPMLKGGLEMLGLAGGPVRDSGAVLDAAGRRRVRRLMREKGLL